MNNIKNISRLATYGDGVIGISDIKVTGTKLINISEYSLGIKFKFTKESLLHYTIKDKEGIFLSLDYLHMKDKFISFPEFWNRDKCKIIKEISL